MKGLIELARNEAIGIEKVFLDLELRVALLEIVHLVALNSLAENEVLSPSWRANGIGLYEAHARQRVGQSTWRE